MTGKRWLLVLLFFWLGMMVYSSFLEEKNFGSIYSSGPHGVRAFFLFLQHYGKKPEAWLKPLSELQRGAGSQVLFLVSPLNSTDAGKLVNWVSAGNQLIVLGAEISEHLARTFKIRIRSKTKSLLSAKNQAKALKFRCPPKLWAQCQKVQAIDDGSSSFDVLSASPAPRSNLIALPGQVHFVLRRGQAEILSGRKHQAKILSLAQGRGRVWFFTSPAALINRNLRAADNLRLFYQMATAGQTIYFDEFNHGFYELTSGAIKTKRQALILAAGFAVLILGLATLNRLRRFGPIRELKALSHGSSAEFASVLGLLYLEHGATKVLRHYLAAWRQRVQAKFGISAKESDKNRLTALKGRGLLSAAEAEALSGALTYLWNCGPGHLDLTADALLKMEKVMEQDYGNNQSQSANSQNQQLVA